MSSVYSPIAPHINDKTAWLLNRYRAFVYSTMLLTLPLPLLAAPFTNCPSKAFLFQGTPVASYGVNLVTGNFELLERDSGISGNINALGFNETDRYLYGFNSAASRVVRVDSEFKASYLNVTGLPADKNFYVGDVANHHYYLYLRGNGFYKIDLSPLDDNANATLTAELITASSGIRLTDFAFHPQSKKLYGVDNSTGILFQIDPDSGDVIQMADTRQTGTFGAMYFDVNGYFYLSRNQDGQIYRIDLSNLDENTTETTLYGLNVDAIKFADGPSSSQNDGARCASAPLIDEDTPSNIDFGDAPASYQTTLNDNGARHLLDNTTYLGLNAPDGDYDGYSGADSDDNTVVNGTSFNDDDGVVFVTALEAGLDSVINVYASKEGILSAWFDWNIDGDFDDSDEKTLSNVVLKKGANTVVIRVPANAQVGGSWSRFRFSLQADLNHFGGSSSGEVEDHAIMISAPDLSYRFYPGENSWVTLAYEDQWPRTDDYDLNDVVMHYRATEVIRDNSVVRIDIKGELQALGGSYHSGFAVQLPNIATTNVNSQTLRLLHNDIKQQFSGKNGATTYDILEQGNSNAVVVISQDLWKHASTSCTYFRTEVGCDQSPSLNFEISIPLIDPVALADMPAAPFDPFIFATEGLYHGEGFEKHPGRGLEIHLVDKAPTDKFNPAYFQRSDDTSSSEQGRYFRNANNLPWAIEVTEQWDWPSEHQAIIDAYPHFKTFVETQGASKSDWYKRSQAVEKHLFK